MLAARWTCQRLARSAVCVPRVRWVRLASTGGRGALPPGLLQRARRLANEHDILVKTLADDFDSKTALRLGEIASVATALRDYEAATTTLTELQSLLASNDDEMRQMAQEEIQTTNTELSSLGRTLSVALTPKDPYAELPCLLEIRPGPGGMEARHFADKLFQMYKTYCENQGLRCRVVKYEVADGPTSGDGEIPLQEAVLEVQSTGAYDIFRGEAGMHRVQRVPATEKSGRTHTSAVAVWVLPSFPEDGSATDSAADFNNPGSDFYIDPAEVRVERMRASGAGGQHVNKTESAIRLTHIPTGTVVSMQDARSQQQNREVAWRLLRSSVASQRREARQEEAQKLKDSVLGKHQITRGDKIRTYNYGQDRCTDHRVPMDVHNLPNVLSGGDMLGRVMSGAQEWLLSKDLQVAIAEEQAAGEADDTRGATKT